MELLRATWEGGREAPAALDLVFLTVLENGAKY